MACSGRNAILAEIAVDEYKTCCIFNEIICDTYPSRFASIIGKNMENIFLFRLALSMVMSNLNSSSISYYSIGCAIMYDAVICAHIILIFNNLST